jgi:hypothetical protein
MINLNFPEIKADLNRLYVKKRFVFTIVGFLILLVSQYKEELKTLIYKEEQKKKEDRVLMKNKDERTKKSEMLFIEGNRHSINGLLEEIRKRNHADFVAINGFHKNDSLMTRFYESQSPDKITIQNATASRPVKPFESSFYTLRKATFIYIPDATTYKEDLYLSKTILSFGLKSVLYVALYDTRIIEPDGIYRMVGFLSFEFSNKTSFEEARIKTMLMEKYLILPYIL